MQNNVIELTEKLLRSLDSNYNVIDMPAVVEIISQLEKVAITKELLQTTRLGKYINELRKKTTNEALSKRAKELVKKWRNAVLPESNGQIKQSTSPPLVTQEDVNLNQFKASKKRPAKEPPDLNAPPKRPKLNGGIPELDFSDNSNSSFKDVIAMKQQQQQEPKLQQQQPQQQPQRDVIIINSDSNSSLPEKGDPPLDQQMPKKRGRKKGSKNHRNLIDEAETSFTNKLAVSRGNSKVKTTQELIASLQNKSSNPAVNSISTTKPKEDLMEKAAKLTERVSMIDQQLNTSGTRSKNSRKLKSERNERVIESGSVINDKSLLLRKEEEDEEDDDDEDDDDINVVDEEPNDVKREIKEERESKETENANANIITSLDVEEALALLPPIDKSVLLEDEDEVQCTCILKETKSDFSVEEDAEPNLLQRRYEFVEDGNCPARDHLQHKYHLDHVTEEQARRLHAVCIPNLNGNRSLPTPKDEPRLLDDGLYADVVPNVTREYLPKDAKCFAGENFKKYSFSEAGVESECGEGGGGVVKSEVSEERTGDDDGDTRCFREWHDVIAVPSYNGEIFKILPYVIID
ncbi:unnamed protein product [Callosobruchus maculatus]|uniref:Mediator of RNA polymerase II transcription subunit 26 n=1 Tax=Callosobruchus maculatus TaxID=64391 RepID=A0A653CZ20_CALMS|nr:unnamed protein product [Callosobruchus maculatus]